MLVETPDGFLPERAPPIIGIGPDAELEADLDMHGAIGGVGVFLPLTLGVVVMVFDRFQMPCRGPITIRLATYAFPSNTLRATAQICSSMARVRRPVEVFC